MAPTLPDVFVVVPNEIRQVGQSLLERRRSGKQKTTTPSGNDYPELREKFPIRCTGKRSWQRKARPEG
jgi:hypothetical protein